MTTEKKRKIVNLLFDHQDTTDTILWLLKKSDNLENNKHDIVRYLDYLQYELFLLNNLIVSNEE